MSFLPLLLENHLKSFQASEDVKGCGPLTVDEAFMPFPSSERTLTIESNSNIRAVSFQPVVSEVLLEAESFIQILYIISLYTVGREGLLGTLLTAPLLSSLGRDGYQQVLENSKQKGGGGGGKMLPISLENPGKWQRTVGEKNEKPFLGQ